MSDMTNLNTILIEKFPNHDYGSLGQGSRISPYRKYLAYNDGKWDVIYLNLFQRALRALFGFYKSTHIGYVIKQINEERNSPPSQFIERMKVLWKRAYPLLNFPQPNQPIVQTLALPKQSPIETETSEDVKKRQFNTIKRTIPQSSAPETCAIPQVQVQNIPEVTTSPLLNCMAPTSKESYSKEMLQLISENADKFKKNELKTPLKLILPDQIIWLSGTTKIALRLISSYFTEIWPTDVNEYQIHYESPLHQLTEDDWKLLVDFIFSTEPVPNEKFLMLLSLCRTCNLEPKNKEFIFKKVTTLLSKFVDVVSFNEMGLILEDLSWMEKSVGKLFFEEEFKVFCQHILTTPNTMLFVNFYETLCINHPQLLKVFYSVIDTPSLNFLGVEMAYENLLALLKQKQGKNLTSFIICTKKLEILPKINDRLSQENIAMITTGLLSFQIENKAVENEAFDIFIDSLKPEQKQEAERVFVESIGEKFKNANNNTINIKRIFKFLSEKKKDILLRGINRFDIDLKQHIFACYLTHYFKNNKQKVSKILKKHMTI